MILHNADPWLLGWEDHTCWVTTCRQEAVFRATFTSPCEHSTKLYCEKHGAAMQKRTGRDLTCFTCSFTHKLETVEEILGGIL